MTREEILRSYKQAKNPKAQITVLAELNLCGTAQIVETLIEAGIPADQLPKIKMRKAPRTDYEVAGRPKATKPESKDADTLERAIESKLRKRVKAYGGRCLKWVSPGESGVPDRVVLLPNSRVVFVETKRPKGGKLSKLQLYWARTLRGLGHDVWVVCDAEDLAEFEKIVLGRSKK